MGVITAIIGAVRIGGPAWLRAIIGRARENLASAEVELTTSTSSSACELWNGQAVVRLLGAPKIVELIYFSERLKDEAKGEAKQEDKLFTVVTAKEEGLLYADEDKLKQWINSFIAPRPPARPRTTTPKRRFFRPADEESQRSDSSAQIKAPNEALNPQAMTSAPNIPLNLSPARKKWELRLFALFGIVLQVGVIVFFGYAATNPQLNQTIGGEKSLPYGYPLNASGTAVLVAVMLICSFILFSTPNVTAKEA